MPRPPILLTALALPGLAAVAVLTPWPGRNASPPEAPAPPRATARLPEIAIDPDGALVRRDTASAVGTRTPGTVTPAARGIRCPDGSFLPLLNGVAAAPALIRSAEHGPLPPVVARVVDAAGFEWYEHADGSLTTSRPQVVHGPNGERTIQIITIHTADAPSDGSIRPLPEPRQR
jgi:hypothetical protein